MQVIENGASVEFGRSGGGFVNVVTKSGGNDFHGSAFYYSRPQSLTARFADGTDPEDQQTQQFGASTGGPVLHDKLFFFGAWDQQKQSTTIPITSSLVTDPDIAARYPKIGQTDTSYVQEQNGRVFFGRLDLQLGNRHRVYARANYATYDGLNGTSSSQTQSTSHNGVEGLTSSSYVTSWNALFSPKPHQRPQLPVRPERHPAQGQRPGPARDPARIDQGPTCLVRRGQSPPDSGDGRPHQHRRHGELPRRRSHDQGRWRLQRHRHGRDLQDLLARVFFFNYPTEDLAKQAFLVGRWTQYIEFLGLNGNTVDQAGRFNAHQKELAFFAQDQWYVTSSLTITAGLRYERLDNPERSDSRREEGPRAGREERPARRADPGREQPVVAAPVVRVVAREGREERRAPLPRPVLQPHACNPLLPALLEQRRRRGDLPGERERVGPTPGFPAPGWGAAFNPNAVQQLGSLPPGTSFGAVGVWAIASDFKNPHTDRISLGAEREFFGIAWGLEGIWAKGYDLERLNDANLVPAPAANCPALDPNSGSPCYGASPISDAQSRINPNYDRVVVYTSDARSDYKAATLYFRRNFAAGFRFFGSLTRASDYDTDANERNFLGFTLWDVNNPELNWGPSDRDIRWRGVANASYERRFGSVDAFSSVLFSYQTGRPYNAYTSADANKDGISTDRATIDGVVVGRNAFRQPDSYTVDVRLGLGFRLGPGTLAVFLDVFNLTNTGNRSTTLTVYPGSGSTAFGTLNAFTTTPRTLQLSGRYDF